MRYLRTIPGRLQGAASPQILSLLIIAGGFLGMVMLYMLEPWLIPPAEDVNNVSKANKIENAVPAEDLKVFTDYMKSQIVSLAGVIQEPARLLNDSLNELEGQLSSTGSGYSCPPLDNLRYTLQQYQPNFVYLRDWVRENRKRVDNQELQGILARMLGDLDGIVKNCDSVISTMQSYEGARFDKAARNAFRKLPPRFRTLYNFVDRANRHLEKIP